MLQKEVSRAGLTPEKIFHTDSLSPISGAQGQSSASALALQASRQGTLLSGFPVAATSAMSLQTNLNFPAANVNSGVLLTPLENVSVSIDVPGNPTTFDPESIAAIDLLDAEAVMSGLPAQTSGEMHGAQAQQAGSLALLSSLNEFPAGKASEAGFIPGIVVGSSDKPVSLTAATSENGRPLTSVLLSPSLAGASSQSSPAMQTVDSTANAGLEAASLLVMTSVKNLARDQAGAITLDGKTAEGSGNANTLAGLLTLKSEGSAMTTDQLFKHSMSALEARGGAGEPSHAITLESIAEERAQPLAQSGTSSNQSSNLNQLGENARMQMPVNISFGRPEWAGQVAERAAMMSLQKLQFAELQLDPPELGSLQVKVTVNAEQQASVTFISPHASVRDALDQSVMRLRELLEQQGLDLVDVNVSDQQQQESSEDGESTANSGLNGSAESSEEEAEVVVQDSLSHYGVDFYA